MADIDNRTFHAQAESIRTASTAERQRVIGELVTQLHTTSTLSKWGAKIARDHSYTSREGRADDIPQVIAEHVVRVLSNLTPDGEAPGDWLRALYGSSSRAVASYLASGQVSAASNMSGASSRARTIRTVHAQLTSELGREPSKAEIIERANTHMREHRKNAAKQGALISERDFTESAAPALSLDAMVLDFPATHDEDAIDARLDAFFIIRKLRKLARVVAPQHLVLLNAVLDAWMESLYLGERPTVLGLAQISGLDEQSTRRGVAMLDKLLAIAREQSAAAERRA